MDHLIFVALGVLWGTNFLLMKLAGAYLTPVEVSWLRVTCGALPILAYAVGRRSLRVADLRHAGHFAVLSIATSIVPYLAFAWGTRDLKSGAAGAIAGVVPPLTATLTALSLPGERLTWPKLVGLFAGSLGVAMVAQVGSAAVAGEHVIRGLGFMLAGAAGYAVAAVYQRRFVTPLRLSPVALACYQTLFAAVILSLFAPTAGLARLAGEPGALWTLTLGLGVIGTGVTFIMYYHLIDRLGPVSASAVFYLPPVSSLAIGSAIAGEWITPGQVVGAVLILVGVKLAKRG